MKDLRLLNPSQNTVVYVAVACFSFVFRMSFGWLPCGFLAFAWTSCMFERLGFDFIFYKY
tara:strand:+ start:115 stop:294 length:180 start_codon:yes stop_codon:yes gene_type:complete